jgi:hypothetical protein
MAIDVTSERAQGSSPPRPAVPTAKDEKDRFKAILLSVVKKRDGQLFAIIPPGHEYPLRRKNGPDDVRDWALGEYIEQYGANGKQPNYEAARAEIWRELGEPAQDHTQEEKEEKRGRGRPKSKLSEEDAQALYIIRTFNDWQEDGPYPGSLFVRVPPITDTRGLDLGDPARLARRYTGMWYLPGQDKPPVQLIDAALYYTDVTYPHSSAKNKPHTGNLRAVNGRGKSKLFPFTGNELRDRENNKFKHFAKWPQDIPTQARLLNAMEALFASDPATIWHEQIDALGYAETETQGLVFALTNGIETARGFIPNEKAPVVGPDLISAGNGYQGVEEKLRPSDDVYRLIFEDIAEEDAIRIAAKLGALMYTWFPPGTVEQAGRLPFYVDSVGSPSCGKTPEDNMIKSHEGVGFRYDSPPFLTNDDTKASAPARMQIMKHLAYSDDDRKCSPGAPGFQAEHASRKRHINYYADGQGAGSRYYEHATRIASRGEPQGFALGTSNYDHAIYALSTPGLDEDPVEFRACTFVVSSREIRTEENSRAIFEKKAELYAMGRAARAWLMHEYNRDPRALREYLQDLGARAGAEMQAAFPFDWYESKQKNHTRILVWGVLAWLDFLAKYGPGREQGYLYQKLSYLLSGIVEDRAIRADYLDQMIRKRESGADLGEFVLDAIRYTLANRRAYIVDQRGEPLTLGDLPPDYGLNSFGYFQHTALAATTDSAEYQWDHAHTPLGHYMKRSHTIAFSMPELYAGALVPYAREQKRELPRIDEIKKKMIESGLLAEEHVLKIRGRNARYISISLEKLDLPGRAVVDAEEETEKDSLMQEVDKVVSLEQARAGRGLSPAPVAQGEQVMNGQAASRATDLGVTHLTAENEDPFSFDPYA